MDCWSESRLRIHSCCIEKLIVSLRSSWRDLCLIISRLDSGVLRCCIIFIGLLFLLLSILFAHHLFELVFVLLTENSSPLLTLRNEVIRCSIVIESVGFFSHLPHTFPCRYHNPFSTTLYYSKILGITGITSFSKSRPLDQQ